MSDPYVEITRCCLVGSWSPSGRLDRARERRSFDPVATVRGVWLFVAVSLLGLGCAPPALADEGISTSARPVFEKVRAAVVKVRTLVRGSDTHSSTGTGFVVSNDGMMVTNYHVVSEFVMQPEIYQLNYETHDHRQGKLELVAVDVVNDLAVVKSDLTSVSPLVIRDEAPSRGENGYSLGYPLNQGITITEGTFNGISEDYFIERFHFTGALNPGMSGGPAVTADGAVFGVNVSGRRDAEMVNFLVPGRFAAALLQTARSGGPPVDFAAELWQQVERHSSRLFQRLHDQEWETVALGGFQVPGKLLPGMSCGRSVDVAAEKKYELESNACILKTDIYINDELRLNSQSAGYSWIRNRGLNSFQFANLVENRFRSEVEKSKNKEIYFPVYCLDRIVALKGARAKVLLCAAAFRKRPTLSDFHLTAMIMPEVEEALSVTLALSGVTTAAALEFIDRILGGIQWQPSPSSK
ncbi:MAG: trypsin-like peptidase domain-containing protein [Magnetococcales bacterium]|nr:trypsin-like peptidase domain-containing protein [Magnetococcales bacterium]MBF0156565.1 trypsin-like peptidase domain-containing protein [Magnetococcales bacterium]